MKKKVMDFFQAESSAWEGGEGGRERGREGGKEERREGGREGCEVVDPIRT